MLFTSEIWFDLAGSVAIICFLTMAYSNIQRMFLTQRNAEILLGIAFGGVAWLQMNIPLEPMEGLIIDLRNVPLALCAAFLGWRATLVCFLIAALTRFQIGGIGMPSGILGMAIISVVGACWARFTRKFPQRRLHHLVLLSLLASAHLNGAWILPDAARTWFLTNASLPFVIFNAISITLCGYLLNVEQSRIKKEGRIAASVMFDPDHGAWTKPAFEREIRLRVSAGKMLPPAGLLFVRVRNFNFLLSLIPSFWHDKLLGLVHMRLKGAFENADLAFTLGSSILVLPLSAEQFLKREELLRAIVRRVGTENFQFSSELSKMVTVDTKAFSWGADQTLDDVIENAKFGASKFPSLVKTISMPRVKSVNDRSNTPARKSTRKSSSANAFPKTNNEVLFGKAAFLMRFNQAN